jgi:hypothetical protein
MNAKLVTTFLLDTQAQLDRTKRLVFGSAYFTHVIREVDYFVLKLFLDAGHFPS